MFNDIGGKLKALAEVLTWLGMGASVLIGIIELFANGDTPLPGLLIIAIGCLGSWLSSFVLYGFGQLVENSDKLVAQIEDIKDKLH